MASLNFNAAEIDTTSRDAIPSGTYEAVVSDSEMRPTKSGSGVGINLTFEILSEGPAKGRKVFNWINFEHPNAKAQQIGREELARICKAVGIGNLTDTCQLHNLPLIITVGVDKNDPTRNVIRSYAAKNAPSAPQQATKPTGAAPWAR